MRSSRVQRAVIRSSLLAPLELERNVRNAAVYNPLTAVAREQVEATSPRERSEFCVRERTRGAVRAEQRNAHRLGGALLDSLVPS
jgi:hypothetical protein